MPNDADRCMVGLTDKLGRGESVYGFAITGREPSFAEIAATEFDFIWIETEHTSLTVADVERLIIAVERNGAVPAVRVRNNNANEIGQVLDMGARIVIVPHIDSAGDARRAVEAAKYAPLGKRGCASVTRSTGYGRERLDREAMKRKNAETMLMPVIESMSAVEQIDEIAALDGIDAAVVGYADLCQDMGIDVDPHHPRCSAAIERIGKALGDNACHGAFITADRDGMAAYKALGYNMFLVAMDTRLYGNGVRDLAALFR